MVKRICVVGIGNPWASDDAVGPEVVRQLAAAFEPASNQESTTVAPLPDVVFLTVPQPNLELLDVLERCDLLLVVDAVASGAPPGHLHRQPWQPGGLEARGLERASSHGFGVREILDLAASLGRRLPAIVLWGIEVAVTKPGQSLSPAVAAALPQLVEDLGCELNAMVQTPKIGADQFDQPHIP
jgi:hydrogenase maturation protease